MSRRIRVRDHATVVVARTKGLVMDDSRLQYLKWHLHCSDQLESPALPPRAGFPHHAQTPPPKPAWRAMLLGSQRDAQTLRPGWARFDEGGKQGIKREREKERKKE